MNQATKFDYTDGEWAAIAKTLDLPDITKGLKQELLEALCEYSWAKSAEEDRLTRRDRRRLLEEIILVAENFKSLLKKADYPTLNLLGSAVTIDNIGLFIDGAKRALAKVPKRSGEPKKARLQFVCALAGIFEKATRSRPTRRVHDVEYGPFREFVEACLRPVDAHAMSGVDADIRETIKRRSGKSGPT
jgi:hypothetical protein